ncbi:hypothetical protein FOCG_07074 [Fusarium oxysporum f. sp. radicis-lycopersici 26381]|uniref:Uncharacterized protein n=2 Tax=Fusarium oxysporum TaxID=5507 RepID=W9JA82_FUSOX|nr:hypothetical protein FOYG_01797 [Fusarium oxysporum NRRL 32931]EWZ48623.1 hypothetical protein FOZG_04131 [Fusarium oxysporum Fo47]EWZ93692.1 hypothetical protein FOWG_06370 [Fusarium oxysporum f. sp. lycopersici MN25]EXL53957.1 hypothetical protein FOCG_07074 [Fusarium oxysporum f. sp. radicis-lycopersici 26381]KAJ0151832.1 Acid phosphatase [Fusarium oxysporum f. sp. albedinis]KAJ4122634.1 hypothetical protein NW765_005468 [Fusarium oxysporum]
MSEVLTLCGGQPTMGQASAVCHQALYRDFEHSTVSSNYSDCVTITLSCRRKAQRNAQSHHAFYRVIASGHLMVCRRPMQCHASKKWHSVRPVALARINLLYYEAHHCE